MGLNRCKDQTFDEEDDKLIGAAANIQPANELIKTRRMRRIRPIGPSATTPRT